MARKIAKKEYSYTHGQLFSRISAVMKFVAEGPTRTLGSLNVAPMRAARDDSLHVRGPHQGEKCPGACAPNTDSCPREHCDRKSLSTVRASHLLRASFQALGKPDFQVC